MNKQKLAIVIPTYNEKENIYNLILDIGSQVENLNIDTTIFIIDDNSPDGTAELLRLNLPRINEKYPFFEIKLISREGKLGLGTAYIRGFHEALSIEADYILQMDADFSHQPKYIPLFLDSIGDADLVIGSRYIRGGGIENWSLLRKIISKGGSMYARLLLGLNVQDMTGGFKLWKAETLKSIPLDRIKSNGYSFQIEMTYRACKKGFKIKEIPIIFPDRRTGRSKMSKKIFMEAIGMVWRLRLDKSIKNTKK